ncbi:MAG: hydroxysqualene dehydroxylase HpnE [Candidatus Bipolaricaulota bacterium]
MVDEPESAVIIGGGLAGLAAGVGILAGGFKGKLTLLEKGPSLGGRTNSLDYMGRTLDLGQHMHVAGFDYYLTFLNEIGLKGKIQTQPKLNVEFRDDSGKAGKVKSSPLPPPFHLAPSFFGFPFISPGQKIKLIRPLLTGLLMDRKKDGANRSFGDWLRSKGASEESIEKLWNSILVPTLNAVADDVSLSMGMMIVERVLLDKEGGRLGRLNCSLSRIGKKAAEYIRDQGGRIKLNSRVQSVKIIEEGRHLVVLADGTTLETEVLLSAVPGHELSKILPEWTRERFSHPFWKLDWNSIINVHLFFEESVMSEEYFGYLNGSAGWVFNINRNGDDPGKHICLTISNPGSLEEMDPKELVDKVREDLSSPLPRIRQTSLEDSLVLYQPRATIKATPKSHDLRPPQNSPFPGFFLAGDWTDTGWPSTMESAVRSGYSAAKLVLEYVPGNSSTEDSLT